MRITIFLILCGLLFSCSDFIDRKPENAVTYSNYFRTEKEVATAVKSMHAIFRSHFSTATARLYRQRALPFDYVASDWQKISRNDFKNTYAPSSPVLYWGGEYEVIAITNLIIDNIHKANLPEDRVNFYLTQAYGVRAMAYLRIIQLWGDAPLVEHLEDVSTKARQSWVKISEYNINCLEEAVKVAPSVGEMKDMNGNPVIDKQCPARGTLWTLLAHYYGWQAEFNNQPELLQKAIKACDEVIGSGDYQLANSINEVIESVMSGNSTEGIFELNFVNITGEENNKGACIAGAAQKYPIEPLTTPATKRTFMAIKFSTVFKMYSENDQRREYFYDLENTSFLPESQSQGYAYLAKFPHYVTFESGALKGRLRAYLDNEIMFRLAGVYLLRAEYRAKTGDISGAANDLNVVRRRAGASEYSASEGDIRKVISQERIKELFGEGDNFTELLREGFVKDLPGFAGLTEQDVKDGAVYLPLSSMAFENNTLQVQYPYWERQGY